jgi:hypothetical protein
LSPSQRKNTLQLIHLEAKSIRGKSPLSPLPVEDSIHNENSVDKSRAVKNKTFDGSIHSKVSKITIGEQQMRELGLSNFDKVKSDSTENIFGPQ